MTILETSADRIAQACWVISGLAFIAVLYLMAKQTDRRLSENAARKRARWKAKPESIDPKVLARMRATAASIPRDAAEPRPLGAAGRVGSPLHRPNGTKRPA